MGYQRNHQLRRKRRYGWHKRSNDLRHGAFHLAAHGHPIAGDDLYGGATRWRGVRDPAVRGALAALTRPLLHAEQLAVAEAGIDVSAPLPAEYVRLLSLLEGGGGPSGGPPERAIGSMRADD